MSDFSYSATTRRKWRQCQALALYLDLNKTKLPATIPMECGNLRHDVLYECFMNKEWPPSSDHIKSEVDAWIHKPRPIELSESDKTEQVECLSEMSTRTELWPDPSSVLAAESWGIPDEFVVDLYGSPGMKVYIGDLPDGTRVNLWGRMDLVFVPNDSSRLRIRDYKGKSGVYRYQAECYAVMASIIWPGFVGYDYEALYLTSGFRLQTFQFDEPWIDSIRTKILMECEQIQRIRTDKTPAETLCSDCQYCPLSSTCATYQAALAPFAPPEPPQRWPTDLTSLTDSAIVDIYSKYIEPSKAVEKYGDKLKAEVKKRVKSGRLSGDECDVVIHETSNGYDIVDMAAFLEFVDLYRLPIDMCVGGKADVAKALRTITDTAKYDQAVARLKMLRKPRESKQQLKIVNRRNPAAEVEEESAE